MKILNTFLKERGWLHNTGMLAIIYLLLFWGYSEYAQKTDEMISAMIADLIRTGLFWSIIIFSFFAFVVGWLIEVAEESKGAKYSWWDIAWTTLGAPFAFVLYQFLPQNNIVLAICILYLIFIGRELYKTFKGKTK